MTLEKIFKKRNLKNSAILYEYSPQDYKELESVYEEACLEAGEWYDKSYCHKTIWDDVKRPEDSKLISYSKRKLAKVYAIRYSGILNEEYCGKLNDPVNAIELFLASNLDAQDRIKTKRSLSFGIFCEFHSLVRYAIQQAVETKKTGGYFDKELRRYELERVRLFVKTF